MRNIVLIGIFFLTTIVTVDTPAAIAVVDIKNLRRQILNYARMIEQINNQQKQISQLSDAINLADRQLNAITGTRGVSTLLNNAVFKEARRYLPTDTREIRRQNSQPARYRTPQPASGTALLPCLHCTNLLTIPIP